MKLARVLLPNAEVHVALLEEASVRVLDMTQMKEYRKLSDILHAPDPAGLSKYLVHQQISPVAIEEVRFLAPVDRQDVWAAGVTYKRSQQARMDESEHGASHYDLVYSADRPELFYKANPSQVVSPGEPVRVRTDSNWSVPEPELALMVTPEMKICGYTIGNDMSARDIEGENPLYLPQAKVYNQSCALGPAVLLADEPISMSDTSISLKIERESETVFEGATSLDQLHRSLEELATWLGKELDFPNGAILLTGTGIIPPDQFTLQNRDVVTIEIAGIGTLVNPVVKD